MVDPRHPDLHLHGRLLRARLERRSERHGPDHAHPYMRRRESSAFLTSRAGPFPGSLLSGLSSLVRPQEATVPSSRPVLHRGRPGAAGSRMAEGPPAEPARHASWTPPPRACHADPGRGVDPGWAAHASGILGLCHCEAHLGITLYPVGRIWPPEPQSLMHDEDRPGTNGTHLRKRSAREP